jgi:hypothetical protein
MEQWERLSTYTRVSVDGRVVQRGVVIKSPDVDVGTGVDKLTGDIDVSEVAGLV